MKNETYNVMAVTAEESAKADRIPDYSPAEYQVGTITADSETAALKTVKRGIKSGIYPSNAMPVPAN